MKLKIDNKIIQKLNLDTELIENPAIKNWAKKYLYGHINHYNGILGQLSKALKIRNANDILEIGGVPGQLTSYLSMEGFNIEMVDINPDRIKCILEKYKIKNYKTNIETESLDIKDETFDIVLFNEVFEHLHINPLKVLLEIHRVLRKDGLLVMSVPNINPLMKWQFLFGKDFNDNLKKEFAKVDNIGHMGHFRLYSKMEIDEILKDFDFEIIDYSYEGNYYNKSSRLLKVFKFLFKNKMKNQYHVIAKKI